MAQQVLPPRRIGDQIYYDAPDYAHAYAMRMDTFPADGEFAGSDPDLAFKQLIMEAGADIAILEPAAYPARFPEVNHAMSCALNDWQANHWLDSHNNWHGRWRGSICARRPLPLHPNRTWLCAEAHFLGAKITRVSTTLNRMHVVSGKSKPKFRAGFECTQQPA